MNEEIKSRKEVLDDINKKNINDIFAIISKECNEFNVIFRYEPGKLDSICSKINDKFNVNIK